MKDLCKFQVDTPINAKDTAVQGFKISIYIYIVAAMSVGKRITWDLGVAMEMLYLRGVWLKSDVKYLCQIVQNRPKTTFRAKNKNQHPILNPCVKLELNSLRSKQVMEKPYF